MSGNDYLHGDDASDQLEGGEGLDWLVGGAATASSHRIVYDQGTGALYYDADGSGSQAQVQFAQFQKDVVTEKYAALTTAHFQLFTL